MSFPCRLRRSLHLDETYDYGSIDIERRVDLALPPTVGTVLFDVDEIIVRKVTQFTVPLDDGVQVVLDVALHESDWEEWKRDENSDDFIVEPDRRWKLDRELLYALNALLKAGWCLPAQHKDMLSKVKGVAASIDVTDSDYDWPDATELQRLQKVLAGCKEYS